MPFIFTRPTSFRLLIFEDMKLSVSKTLLLFLSAFLAQPVLSQDANRKQVLPKLESIENKWVDSIYNQLKPEERIAQLFMVATYSGGEKYNQEQIEKLIREHGIGGLIFMQGTPAAQAIQTNHYQKISQVPLLLAMDAEWGLGMRLKGVRDFPRQIMMGAMSDSELVYKLGAAVAAQCRRMGVHINFAPVVDVNNNPKNPVINFRSFGENKQKVANYAIQYMRALQQNGVMACAKHFPGHGDTEVDSHKDMPEIGKSRAALDAMELYPFRQLIANGVQSVMVAHLKVPALEPNKKLPTTLSYQTITSVLKNELGFSGLVFTDALNMEGVAKYYSPGDVDLRAFEAGNDVLLFSQDVPSAIQKISEALRTGRIPESRLESSVKKILHAKFQYGLSEFKAIDTTQVLEDLNELVSPLRQQIAERAITLLSDPNTVLDRIKRSPSDKVVYVGIGTSSENAFTEQLKRAGVREFDFISNYSVEQRTYLKRKYANYKAVIIGIHNLTAYPKGNFGLDEVEVEMVNALSQWKNSVSVLFGNPYAMGNFCALDGFLIAYDESDETQVAAAKIITGLLKPLGRLPVGVCPRFKAGDGIVSIMNPLGEIQEQSRFGKQYQDIDSTRVIKNLRSTDRLLECCVSPNALGINMNVLDRLDDFLQSCVQRGAFPGCRILVAQKGKVFYDKSFGYLTQDRKNSVDIQTVYDVASVTKAAATTLAVMRLYEQGKLDIYASLGRYLPIVKGSNKESLKICDILSHQAGLKSWIPFYKETLDTLKRPRTDIYSKTAGGKFAIPVSANLYMRRDWVDTMWKRIIESPLENSGRYTYSDLDFIFLQKLVERISGQSLDEYLSKEFYQPLGLKFTCFNPRKNKVVKEIAPSEYDDYFRYQTIQGYVHDMGAAMFGGVSGHAGLFSTAEELGIIFQMLLNGGIYQGKRYFKPATVELFTGKFSRISRRGLGFDKPETRAGVGNPCSDQASRSTFGHQGFTGTCVWADPETDLVFVFLSNRTYPSADNKLINSLDVREKAQSMIYTALGVAGKPRH